VEHGCDLRVGEQLGNRAGLVALDLDGGYPEPGDGCDGACTGLGRQRAGIRRDSAVAIDDDQMAGGEGFAGSRRAGRGVIGEVLSGLGGVSRSATAIMEVRA
jgi:hypothetical protein